MLLHGEERRFIRFMPKVVYQALERLRELQSHKATDVEITAQSVAKQIAAQPAHQVIVHEIRDQINLGHWDAIKKCDDK